MCLCFDAAAVAAVNSASASANDLIKLFQCEKTQTSHNHPDPNPITIYNILCAGRCFLLETILSNKLNLGGVIHSD